MATAVDAQSLVQRREDMVRRQLAARGLRDERVLAAMREVPREEFLPAELAEFAYEDNPLPIGEEQTISQPFVVALMAEALQIQPGDRVLEIGTGSGYAAAVLARLASEVWTIERHASLAVAARATLERLGFDNVHVEHADGTLGWPVAAPYQAIVAAAAGPRIPDALLEQLAPGGRLVMPVGATPRDQTLLHARKLPSGAIEVRDLGAVRFVPLIGAEGFPAEAPATTAPPVAASAAAPRGLPELLGAAAEPFVNIDAFDLDPLLRRIGDARVVLLGEATHGTSEFYRLRGRITRELVTRHGFRIVAAEADWPDAAAVSRWLGGESQPATAPEPFTRFPTWMWRNEEFLDLLRWLRRYNEGRVTAERVGFYGLDLYSLYHSVEAVLGYLEDVDPETAKVARERYGCLSPWEGDPATYGRAVLTSRYASCEREVVSMLGELLGRRLEYAAGDGNRFFDAVQNARLVADAERYYRVMYYGSRESWNLRDQHMFDTLTALLDFHGEGARAVVWAHNSHLGNAAATEMGAHGELNIGQLCRERFGDGCYAIGFGTDHGTVMAADAWDEPGRVMNVRPTHQESYEGMAHRCGIPSFLLPLRQPRLAEARDALLEPRLERAIGVLYRPQTEMQSHYFQAYLPVQFDEWVWLDETRAVRPLPGRRERGEAETFPFGI